jgi:hypothetical protein
VAILFDPGIQRSRNIPLAGQVLDRPTAGWIYVRTTLPVARAEFFRNGVLHNVDTRADLPGVYDFNSSYVDFSFWNLALGPNKITVRLVGSDGAVLGSGSAEFTVGPQDPPSAPVASAQEVPILYDTGTGHAADLRLAGETLDRPTSSWIYVRTALPVARAEFYLNGLLYNVDTRADIAQVFDFNSSYINISFWNFRLGANTISTRLYDTRGSVVGRGSATFTVGPGTP